jgi:hypothetical protein
MGFLSVSEGGHMRWAHVRHSFRVGWTLIVVADFQQCPGFHPNAFKDWRSRAGHSRRSASGYLGCAPVPESPGHEVTMQSATLTSLAFQ